MSDESYLIGNITIDDGCNFGAESGYRAVRNGEIIAVFPGGEKGLILASLFASYIADMFPDGEINQTTVDEKFNAITAAQLKRERKAEKRANGN